MTSRSQSRKAKGRSQQQPKPVPKARNSKDGAPPREGEGEQEEEIFQQRLPWVVSSPHARVQAAGPTEAVQQSLKEDKTSTAGAPADSKSSNPPDQSEQELLGHLRGLKKALGVLPEELESQMQTLEAKTDKTLTHGHINKLGKLQRQLTSLGTKISELDHNWKVFTDKVMTKFASHQQMYQQCRLEMVQEFQKKSQEIQLAKQEVQNASEALFQAQPPELPAAVDVLDVDSMFEQAQQDDGYMDAADMEDVEGLDEHAELIPGKARPTIQAFTRRKVTSPTKVHAVHLKK